MNYPIAPENISMPALDITADERADVRFCETFASAIFERTP